VPLDQIQTCDFNAVDFGTKFEDGSPFSFVYNKESVSTHEKRRERESRESERKKRKKKNQPSMPLSI